MANKEVLVREWARLWTEHDVDGLMALFTDDGYYEDMALRHPCDSPAKLRDFFEQTFICFPDFVVTLHYAIANDDHGAAEWTMAGTHLADFPGLPTTGKAFSIPGSSIMHFEGDRIRHNRDYWSMTTLKEQLGLKD